MLLQLLGQDPALFFLILLILSSSLVLHELGHAVAALWMGDRTAQAQGRITLNPFQHLDPIGTIMLLVAGVGWARPVPIHPPNFRSYRLGLFVVSIAGIVVNVLLALGFALLVRFLLDLDPAGVRAAFAGGQRDFFGLLALAAYFSFAINLALAVFNLLPVPPLDGSKILQSVLPAALQRYFWQLEANPTYAVVVLVLFLTVLRGPIGRVIGAAQEIFLNLILNLGR
ncbi:site-2 protease family protein [Meiothermus sp. PNK-Is4]|nr:site-2 protease family protein [Meiothermus sp. Pnk-1]RYM38331.1 site-2 protease family protein [Meiothermus sp. PNK-Is4]